MWLLMALQLATTPGIYDLTLEREKGAPTLYSLSIPEGFDPDEPRPLVIALHFAGKNRAHFGRGILTSLVEPGLRELGAIIAAPDSPGQGWTSPDSERAVLALVDFLTESYRIDPKRIVLTGYSMGSMGTWTIASRHPDRFTAVVPMAGAPRNLPEDELRVFTKLPLYAIHSRIDSVVPLEPTETAIEQLRNWNAADVELTIVDGVTHYNVQGFTEYLREASRWLEKVWRRD